MIIDKTLMAVAPFNLHQMNQFTLFAMDPHSQTSPGQVQDGGHDRDCRAEVAHIPSTLTLRSGKFRPQEPRKERVVSCSSDSVDDY